jgi:processive 1,2-diacylglycerol beta-glucosyltransferase
MGTGHANAAFAVLAALRSLEPGIEGHVVNSFQYANQWLGRMMEDGYHQLLKSFPTLYGLLYENREKPNTVSAIRRWLNHLMAGSFKNLLEEFRPQAVVCTHAFPAGLMSVVKEKFGINVPSLGVITDFVVHPYWVHNNLDRYAVANHDMARQLISRGIDSEAVRVTGIPIDPRFGRAEAVEPLRQRLAVNSGLPVVLVMGGGLGMGPVGRIVRALKRIKRAMHVVILTGKNDKLRERLNHELERLPHLAARVQVLGYVENVFDYMHAADLLVTKPGGLTSAEALACGLPMLIMHPLPGQEMRNAKYLVHHRAAVRVTEENNLPRMLEDMLDNVTALRSMSHSGRRLGRSDAACEAAHLLLDMLCPATDHLRAIASL